VECGKWQGGKAAGLKLLNPLICVSLCVQVCVCVWATPLFWAASSPGKAKFALIYMQKCKPKNQREC